MSRFLLLLLFMISIGAPTSLAQKMAQLHATGVLFGGTSFPGVQSEINGWKVGSFPTYGLVFGITDRLSEKWSIQGEAGFSVYALQLKGEDESYVLDFGSPLVQVGTTRHLNTGKKLASFLRLNSGAQLGYHGNFIDRFPTYEVNVEAPARFYFYLQPEIGIRKQLKFKPKGSHFRSYLELCCYYRYQFNQLGTARLTQNGATLVVKPRGNVLGMLVILGISTTRKYRKFEKSDKDLS